jgi:hypothetical protein
MKTNTTKQYQYKGDLYGYTIVTSADGTVTENVYDEIPIEVAMALRVNLLGELVIDSLSKMQLNANITNVLDANGEEIYVGGLWRITRTAPILGPLGLKAGYEYRANLIDGQI